MTKRITDEDLQEICGRVNALCETRNYVVFHQYGYTTICYQLAEDWTSGAQRDFRTGLTNREAYNILWSMAEVLFGEGAGAM